MMQNSFHDPEKVKAAAPIDTVARVREILYRMDVMVMETFHESVCGNATYSCTLELGDPPMNRRGMTVNGKGMTPRLAQASAYGELMERMQCGELPPPLLDDHLPEDAVLMSTQRYAAECPEELLHMIGLKDRIEFTEFLRKILGDEELCLVPFRSHGKTVLLSEDMLRTLCGTTGLCAGNIPEESILQGIMEAFERYAAKKIYMLSLTPPLVPTELFEGTTVLSRLKKLGMPFTIRDCSLGKKFPVIGLTIIRSDGKRAFRLGAAISPVTALERCLTELYQGSANAIEERFFTEDALDESDEHARYQGYCSVLTVSGGPWPDAVFRTNESYPFQGFGETEFSSWSQALTYYTGLVRQWGSDIYVRAYDTLGFPAYRVYMPGFCEAFLNFTMSREDYCDWMRLRRLSKIVLRLPYVSTESLTVLADAIAAARGALMPFYREPLAVLKHPAMPRLEYSGVLLPLIMAAGGYYAQAAYGMEEFLSTPESDIGPKLLWKAYASLCRSLAQGDTRSMAREQLQKTYGEMLSERCITALDNPSIMFPVESWPVCPDCGKCRLRSRCAVNEMVRLREKIRVGFPA